jgi:hypothetical protein
VLKFPQGQSLILDAILRTNDRDLWRRHSLKIVNDLSGVIALHREKDGVLGREIKLARVTHNRDGESRLVVSDLKAKSVSHQSVIVLASSDECDIATVLNEARAENPADRSRAVDHQSHVDASSVFRSMYRLSNISRPAQFPSFI